MNSYNKQVLDIIAKEQGFIRDNLEKVMRIPMPQATTMASR